MQWNSTSYSIAMRIHRHGELPLSKVANDDQNSIVALKAWGMIFQVDNALRLTEKGRITFGLQRSPARPYTGPKPTNVEDFAAARREDEAESVVCPECDGEGTLETYETLAQDKLTGMFEVCWRCKGEGKVAAQANAESEE